MKPWRAWRTPSSPYRQSRGVVATKLTTSRSVAFPLVPDIRTRTQQIGDCKNWGQIPNNPSPSRTHPRRAYWILSPWAFFILWLDAPQRRDQLSATPLRVPGSWGRFPTQQIKCHFRTEEVGPLRRWLRAWLRVLPLLSPRYPFFVGAARLYASHIQRFLFRRGFPPAFGGPGSCDQPWRG